MEHDDFAVEPVKGLPEKPPAGEVILWQGRPDTWALAREALNLNWIIGEAVETRMAQPTVAMRPQAMAAE
jgi:hypothetical protein